MTATYAKLKYLIGRDLGRFYLLALAVVLQALLEIAMVGTLAPFLSMLMNPKVVEATGLFAKVYKLGGFHDHASFVTAAGIVVFAIYVTNSVYALFINWVIIRFSLRQGSNISTTLFRSYLFQDYLFYLKNNTAELTRVIFQDVARLTDNVLTPFLMLAAKITSVLAILLLLSFVNLKITLIAMLVFGGCYGLVYFRIRGFLARVGELFSHYNNQRFRNVSEAFNGIKDCKIYGIENFYLDNYRHNTHYDAVTQTRRRTLLILPKYIMECIAIGGLLLFSVFLYNRGGSAELVTTITIFAIAAYRVMPYLQLIYADVSQIRSNVNALDLIYDSIASLASATGTALAPGGNVTFHQALHVSDLSYVYPGTENRVLDAVTLEIRPNSIVGFAGSSGSGKSTLIDIILGLLEYREGEVVIDGVRLTAANARNWQAKLGYVPQAIHLVDATLAENVAFGVSAAQIDRDKVWKVLGDAQLAEFVRSELPEGIDSLVGERGARLSGGQRQRIGIARALYRDPEVLVLDEATSALDGLTEHAFIETVRTLTGRMTILMIAHRLTSLRYCDNVVLIEQGRIVDSGSYDYMCAHSSYFLTQLGTAAHDG
jgi:ABC-type multidrug transport system fused ATPase/permease subunit